MEKDLMIVVVLMVDHTLDQVLLVKAGMEDMILLEITLVENMEDMILLEVM